MSAVDSITTAGMVSDGATIITTRATFKKLGASSGVHLT